MSYNRMLQGAQVVESHASSRFKINKTVLADSYRTLLKFLLYTPIRVSF